VKENEVPNIEGNVSLATAKHAILVFEEGRLTSEWLVLDGTSGRQHVLQNTLSHVSATSLCYLLVGCAVNVAPIAQRRRLLALKGVLELMVLKEQDTLDDDILPF
jgi:hypothetical protein